MVDFDSDIDVGDDIVGSSVSGPVQPVAGKTIATKFVQFVIPSDTSGTAMTLAEVMTSTPAGTEAGVVTRPIIDSLPLPSGAATEAKQDTIIGHVDGIEATLTTISGNVDQIEGYVDGIEGALTTLNAKDFATQTTLAAVLTRQSDRTQLTKLTDGTDDVTVASAIDSRNGIDIQHSSVASKLIIDFHSDDAGQRLAAAGTAIFSPGGTRATYYDTSGYGQMLFSCTDNSSGASGGTLYIRWSRDGTNTAYNDPGDGTGFTNYYLIDTSPLVIKGRYIPIQARYVNFVFVQGGANQGSTYPQLAEMALSFLPVGFTNNVEISGIVPVKGSDAALYGYEPVIMGGVDDAAAPALAYAAKATTAGHIYVAQGQTATAANSAWKIEGEIAHDTADTTTNNPIMLGGRGIAHGTTPTAVTANDVTRWYFNREGVPFVIGGGPNILNVRAQYTTAQTDVALVTVSAGTKIIVTSAHATVSNATTVNVAVRIGLGASTTPTASLVALSHPGLAPGGGLVVGDGSGIIVIGGDGDDLRVTCGAATTGAIDVNVSYYTTSS